mmetsp:Transcript_6/g.36  ORF Transcript_6/g.36 Transcript_6/m.36 type:complete len:349 (-) Transcript_6:698-1744(-)
MRQGAGRRGRTGRARRRPRRPRPRRLQLCPWRRQRGRAKVPRRLGQRERDARRRTLRRQSRTRVDKRRRLRLECRSRRHLVRLEASQGHGKQLGEVGCTKVGRFGARMPVKDAVERFKGRRPKVGDDGEGVLLVGPAPLHLGPPHERSGQRPRLPRNRSCLQLRHFQVLFGNNARRRPRQLVLHAAGANVGADNVCLGSDRVGHKPKVSRRVDHRQPPQRREALGQLSQHVPGYVKVYKVHQLHQVRREGGKAVLREVQLLQRVQGEERVGQRRQHVRAQMQHLQRLHGADGDRVELRNGVVGRVQDAQGVGKGEDGVRYAKQRVTVQHDLREGRQRRVQLLRPLLVQ